jgi:phage shock protein PspC (stress-responsive transcriptional regulator)
MTLFTIGVVWVIRILLEVVGAFALLLVGYIVIGIHIDSYVDRWQQWRKSKAREARP